MKCKKGYKKVGDKCVHSGTFTRGHVLKHKKGTPTRIIIVGFLALLMFLWVINPPARSAVGINIIFLVISFIVYYAREYEDDRIGISKKNLLPSIGYGVIFTFLFFLITLVVPGMSIGFPSLPASISDNLKFFLIVLVAPIVETIVFQGALMAWVSNFDRTKDKRRIC